MSILDEIETETWHILVSLYTYQRLVEAIPSHPTRYVLADNLVAIYSLAEMILLRTARLADKRKDARSISMMLKRTNFSSNTAAVTASANEFLTKAEPVLKIRHEQIAHMKPGTLSSYPFEPLDSAVIPAIEALVNLIDIARAKEVSYKYKAGSQESVIDLRASLQCGQRVTT